MSISTFETILQISLWILIATPILSLIVRGSRRTSHLNQVPFGFGPDRARIESELDDLAEHRRDEGRDAAA